MATATLRTCGIAGLVLAVAYGVTANSPSRRLASGGCGPRSLYAVAQALGLSIQAKQIANLFPNQGNYVTFDQLAQSATRLQLKAIGKSMTVEVLRKTKPYGILHVDNSHFVGLVGYDNKGVYIAETIYEGEPQIQHWFYGDLASRWDGRILLIEVPRQ